MRPLRNRELGVSGLRRLCMLSGIAFSCASVHPSPPAPTARANGSELRVIGSYSATLVWALEGAAETDPQASPRGNEYRDWLGLSANDADLAAYRAEHARWMTPHGDAPYDRYFQCSFVATTVDDLIACTARVLPQTDVEIVTRLIRRAHAVLWPKWRTLGPELDAAVADLRSLTQTGSVQDTLLDLRHAASLASSDQLATKIVLVSNPSAKQSLGSGIADAYVVELDRTASPVERLGIIVHELVHLAQGHSNTAPRIEAALIGHGMAGVVAANLWVEATAAAFGNGLCVDRIQPTLGDSRSLYANPAVDAVAHGLLRQWHAGAPVIFDAPLAEELLDALRVEYPASRWSVADMLGRSIAFSRVESVAAAMHDAVAFSLWQYRDSPLPARAARPDNAPPLAPIVFLGTVNDFRGTPTLVGDLQVSIAELGENALPAAVHMGLDSSGTPQVVIVAKDDPSLLPAAREFPRGKHIPQMGWSALPVTAH